MAGALDFDAPFFNFYPTVYYCVQYFLECKLKLLAQIKMQKLLSVDPSES